VAQGGFNSEKMFYMDFFIYMTSWCHSYGLCRHGNQPAWWRIWCWV